MAAFRTAWEQVREQAFELAVQLAKRRPAAWARPAHHALMRDLWARHERALCAIGLPAVELSYGTISRALLACPNGQFEGRQERLQQAEAMLADAEVKAAVSCLESLSRLELLTPGDWDAMPPEIRKDCAARRAKWQWALPACLAVLPRKQRLEWEQRLHVGIRHSRHISEAPPPAGANVAVG